MENLSMQSTLQLVKPQTIFSPFFQLNHSKNIIITFGLIQDGAAVFEGSHLLKVEEVV